MTKDSVSTTNLVSQELTFLPGNPNHFQIAMDEGILIVHYHLTIYKNINQ